MLSFNTDIVIRGSKAEKYIELNTKYNFLYVDIYMMAGVLGFLNGRKDTNENDDKAGIPKTANIPRTVLNSRSDKIDFLCEIVVLNEELGLNEENAMKLAFEDAKASDNKKLERLERFNDYAMGGIDILYNLIVNQKKYGDPVDSFKNALDIYLPNEEIGKKSIDEIFEQAGL